MTDIAPEVAPEVVGRVENATLAELRNVDIDDVYKQMDWLLKSRPTPIDLFHRWENQHWSTQDLDFSEDAGHWRDMEGLFEGFRTELQRTFTLFFLGEQAVTDTLSPMVHAAPDEDSRIFLSTQLVDEARHTVFFSRFFDEVIGVRGGLSEALGLVRDQAVEAYREIFDGELVDVTEAVRRDPDDYPMWVRSITTYHLIVEGMLALTGQKFLLGIVRELGILPGFYSGFTAVARDESRHVNFGVRALLEANARDRAMAEVIEDQVMKLLEPACRIVAAPDRRFVVEPAETPPNLRISPYEVRGFSLFSLTKRLKVAGLPDAFLEEVTRRGEAAYERAWADYEDIHSVEHPRRFWDRMATTSA